jgi:hypothetical protein
MRSVPTRVASEGMEQIPLELLLSEHSVRAGVAAMEQIHGRHLTDMTPEEQATAREHWRKQVEQVLHAVRDELGEPPAGDRGRAVIVLTDADDGDVDVSVAFEPDLHQVDDDQVEGTPAQILALGALAAIGEDDEE